jgi:predicted permease
MATDPNQTRPPRWADQLLEWFVAFHKREDIQGDLQEIFYKQVADWGPSRARRAYGWAVLYYLNPFFRKPKAGDYPALALFQLSMLQNYVKIAWRSLRRNRTLSFINMAGLSLGMACSLIIGLWVYDEWMFNKQYVDGDRIYFVRLTDGDAAQEITPGPLAEALKRDIPQVEKATKFTVWMNDFLLQAGPRSSKKAGIYATEDFFDIFQYPVLEGNPQLALRSPNAIIITRQLALILFGTRQAVGKTLRLDNNKYYKVGAVIEDVPRNGSIQFDWLVNAKGSEEDWMQNWGNSSFLTYIKLKPNSDQHQLEAPLRGLLKRYQPEASLFPVLQPIGDTYLYGEYGNGKPVGGRISYVRTFSLIALLILLIACVNFTNLATARSTLRAKEIGIRKVIGARRLALAGQFMGESVLLTLLSAGLAIGLVMIFLPVINQLVDKQLVLDFSKAATWAGLLALLGITSLLAGSYPALFLSALQPVKSLKGNSIQISGGLFRKSLVVFQFSLSMFLIVGMLIISRQMNFIRTKQLGLNRENLIHIPIEGQLRPKMETFREELQRSNAIQSVSMAGELPIHIGSSGGLDWAGKDPKQDGSVITMKVGLGFTQTLGIRLKEGRDFAPADTMNYLVNESAARMMQVKNPLGMDVNFQRGKGRIIGIMQDFHSSSLHEPIRPLVLSYYPKWTNYFLIRTHPGQTDQAIRAIKQTARQLNPGYPFVYHFVDEAYEKLYRSETLVNTLVNYFGILAIFISCLGLFGLAMFTTEQRTKEIGVRKVLGASVFNIVSLLSEDFLRLVLLAFVIASPVAWYATREWLQGFAYKISPEWWIFALAGLLVVGVALITVSFQSLKAAMLNPSKTLRSE